LIPIREKDVQQGLHMSYGHTKPYFVLFANLTVLLHISNNMEGLFHYTSSFSSFLIICSFTA
ncbi:hypothetical protein, partial [Bacteroides cellulosilyticus]|uniref:hypothetical protein n=1 Tax=Bacteroides cellulosilyticus TaxID=246787 RepID=UPI0032ED2D88